MADAVGTAGQEAASRRDVIAGLAALSTIAALPNRVQAATKNDRSGRQMTEQEQIAIVTRQHELISAGHLEEAAAMFSDPTRNHGRTVPRSRVLAIMHDLKTTFPDLTMPIEEIVASKSNVVVRCRFKGTHLGVGKLPVNGGLMMDVAPSGRHMDVQHIHWYVLQNGLIAEHWASRDDLGMMQQLDLLPETKFDFSKVDVPPVALSLASTNLSGEGNEGPRLC